MCCLLPIQESAIPCPAPPCPYCGAGMECFEGEHYCPDCVRVEPAVLPLVRVPSYHVVYSTRDGSTYVSCGYPSESQARAVMGKLAESPDVIEVDVAEYCEVGELLPAA